MVIDTHAHLMFDQFRGEVPGVFERAVEAGVEKIINVGCSVESSRQAVEMLDEYDGRNGVSLYATLGLHPYDVLDLSDELLGEWEGMIEKHGSKIVAVGEIGLDYFKAKISHDDQQKGFRGQIEFAEKVGLPVIIHNREADEDTFEILREFPDVKAVFHCYGSSLDFARKLWNHGYFTSFTGVITYPGAEELRDVVRECPDWAFMVETDCPFLAPQVHRGGRNEPSYVVEVLKEVARVRRLEFGEAEVLQEKNVKEFYGI